MKDRKAALLLDRMKLMQLSVLRTTREQIAIRELATHNVVLEERQAQQSEALSSLKEYELHFEQAESEYRKRLQSGDARVQELQELSRFVSACQDRCAFARVHYERSSSQLQDALEHQANLVQRLKAATFRRSQVVEMIRTSKALREQIKDTRDESASALAATQKRRSNLFTSTQKENNTK